MEDPAVYQQLGHLQSEVANLKTQVNDMDSKLDTLLERSAKAAGARGILWKVGGASATGSGLLVAIATWWIDTFGGKTP